jgi:hypothetical protein
MPASFTKSDSGSTKKERCRQKIKGTLEQKMRKVSKVKQHVPLIDTKAMRAGKIKNQDSSREENLEQNES